MVLLVERPWKLGIYARLESTNHIKACCKLFVLDSRTLGTKSPPKYNCVSLEVVSLGPAIQLQLKLTLSANLTFLNQLILDARYLTHLESSYTFLRVGSAVRYNLTCVSLFWSPQQRMQVTVKSPLYLTKNLSSNQLSPVLWRWSVDLLSKKEEKEEECK